MAAAQQYLGLTSGARMPAVGLGTYRLGAAESEDPARDRRALEAALEIGYRHIDTATAYHNETFLGDGLQASGIAREELFLTSKLRNRDHAEGNFRGALEDSLQALRTDYLDLYLIHWPLPHEDRYVEAWEFLLAAQQEGLVRDVGVANFLVPHLDRILAATGVAPAVDQIEFHPTWHTPDTVARCRELGVVVEAYSPLARGADFDAAPVRAAAQHHGVGSAEVVLTWALQQGVAVIPKSADPQRLADNFRPAADPAPFVLDEQQMTAISALDGTGQMGHDPNTYAGLQA